MAIRSNPNEQLEELRRVAKQGRLPHERDAWLNVAFFLNHQYTEWDDELDTIRPIARAPHEEFAPRPVLNKIMHYVRTAHHDGMQDRPYPDVLPATDDYEDVGDALVANAWCEWKADPTQTHWEQKLSQAMEWAILAGNGYKHYTWDAQEKTQRITAPSWFEIFLDPYAKSWDDVRYLIHSQFMDIEQVYDTFGKELDPKSAGTVDTEKTRLLRGMGSVAAARGVEVHAFWAKPSRRFPKGRYGVWTGREVLWATDDLPYKHLIEDKMLPYTAVQCILRPDSPYALSPVTYLRPSQMELNKAHAQALMIMELFANPKWAIDTAIDLQKDPDGSPGQILRYTSNGQPGMEPKLVMPASVPSGLYENIQILEQGQMHIVGQHEVSQAQVPGRVESSKAIELLKESDAGALAHLRATTNSSTATGWYQMLELQRQYGTDEEMIITYSRGGVEQVEHWRAGDMKPGYRVRTGQKTGLGRSRTARQENAMNLWREKVITDPNQLLELLEVPTGNALQYTQQAQRKARSENARMAKGETIVPHAWENHAVEIREHDMFRMSHAYEGLSVKDKERLEFHVQTHKKLLKKAVAEQAELQMIAQGQPGTPPGPVPPENAPATQPPPEGEEA
jgi:hypothetical protein